MLGCLELVVGLDALVVVDHLVHRFQLRLLALSFQCRPYFLDHVEVLAKPIDFRYHVRLTQVKHKLDGHVLKHVHLLVFAVPVHVAEQPILSR